MSCRKKNQQDTAINKIQNKYYYIIYSFYEKYECLSSIRTLFCRHS